jgi:hypothetical protein
LPATQDQPAIGGLHPVEGTAIRVACQPETVMTQIHLSDAQTIILSTACARATGLIFPVTASLKGGAVGNVCKSLLKRGLIEEIAAADPDTVWRHDDAGSLTLRATQLAHSTLGLGDAVDEVPSPQQDLTTPIQSAGTKQEELIAMLRADGGATIDEIVAALGWRSHTVRGAMSGALKKKLGLDVTSDKVEGCKRIYKLPAA